MVTKLFCETEMNETFILFYSWYVKENAAGVISVFSLFFQKTPLSSNNL